MSSATTAGTPPAWMVILAQILAGRLQIDEKGNVMPDRLPVVIVQRHAEMAGDRIEDGWARGRAADRRIDDDRIL